MRTYNANKIVLCTIFYFLLMLKNNKIHLLLKINFNEYKILRYLPIHNLKFLYSRIQDNFST